MELLLDKRESHVYTQELFCIVVSYLQLIEWQNITKRWKSGISQPKRWALISAWLSVDIQVFPDTDEITIMSQLVISARSPHDVKIKKILK